LDGSDDGILSIKQRLLHEHLDKDLDPENNELLHGSSALVEEEHKESNGNNNLANNDLLNDDEPVIGEAELSML
jgi:hypothetical protein